MLQDYIFLVQQGCVLPWYLGKRKPVARNSNYYMGIHKNYYYKDYRDYSINYYSHNRTHVNCKDYIRKN